MAFYTISCSIQDSDAIYPSNPSIPVSSFLLSPPLTLKAIQDVFPFEGSFHFRLGVNRDVFPTGNHDYLWLDLMDENKILTYYKPGDIVPIRALHLDSSDDYELVDELEGNVESSYEVYLEKVKSNTPSSRAERYPVETSSHSRLFSSSESSSSNSILKKLKSGVKSLAKEAQEVSGVSSITLKSVTQSANSMWNTFKASLGGHASTITPLSDAAEECLAKLSEDLSSIYTDGNPEHAMFLRDLWSGLFPNESTFQRTSIKWKEAGFQTTDPTTDLKTSGVLAIQAMTYMTKSYPIRSQEMLLNNKENTKTKYPFAIVGVNVTLLLAEVLNLRDQRYLSAQTGYWEMFESPQAFFEIFTMVFQHIDNNWKKNNATRSDFAKIIGEAKIIMSQILSKSPKSLSNFQSIAIEVGMNL